MQKLLSVNYIYLIPLLLAALVGLKSIWQKWPAPFRQFSLFIWATLFVEIFAIAWKWHLHKANGWRFTANNYWIYDPFVIIKFIFFAWFFHTLLSSFQLKNMIRKLSPLIVVVGIAELSFIALTKEPNTYTIAITNLLIVLLCLLYFRQLVNDTGIKTLRQNPAVYISVGTLIYCSATTPLFVYLQTLNSESNSLSASFFYINHIFNIIMYSFYLTSFLCKFSYHK